MSLFPVGHVMWRRRFCALVGLFLMAGAGASAIDLPSLWAERLSAVVAVEFSTETEMERQVGVAFGVVADAEGTVILPAAAVNPRATPAQLQDFRVYRPAEPVTQFAPATYLGQDPLTGWHFLRISPEGRAGLRPISDFAGDSGDAEPAMGATVWGIGLRKKDEDFRPYFMSARISLVQSLPQRTGIALDEVTGPGLPVFDEQGRFVGLGQPGFGESMALFSRRQPGGEPVVLVNPDECAAFRLASEVLPYLGRVPQNVFGRPLAWLGVGGLQPVAPEVAKFLQLEAQAGLVVSEVLAGSPAEAGGLLERDIVISVDGQPLPRLKPDAVLPAYVERELARKAPGDTLELGVLRGTQQQVLTVVLGDAPLTPREANRRYFERLGWTAREFVYSDAVSRRADPQMARGVVAHFVKPNSPAGTAGLRVDDWVQQIDGVEVVDFDSAAAQLAAIEADTRRSEFVLLVSRGSETAVLRVRLN
jgi:serine protease Do